MKKKSCYVVYKGLTPGIYDDWNTCKKQVVYYPNNEYRGYENIQEAINEIEQNMPSNHKYCCDLKGNPKIFFERNRFITYLNTLL